MRPVLRIIYFVLVCGYLLSAIVRVNKPVVFLLSLLATFTFMILGTLAHELGHQAMAKAVGWPVHAVILGRGRERLRARTFGVLWIINGVPLSGATYAWPSDGSANYRKLKRFLVFCAGPLTHVLIIIGAFIVVVFFGAVAGLRNLDAWSSPNFSVNSLQGLNLT